MSSFRAGNGLYFFKESSHSLFVAVVYASLERQVSALPVALPATARGDVVGPWYASVERDPLSCWISLVCARSSTTRSSAKRCERNGKEFPGLPRTDTRFVIDRGLFVKELMR
jgi:hypothetical protein